MRELCELFENYPPYVSGGWRFRFTGRVNILEGVSLIATAYVFNTKTEERREQTVFIGDLPKFFAVDQAIPALSRGLDKIRPTVERRMAKEAATDRITPQIVFSQGPIQTQLNRL